MTPFEFDLNTPEGRALARDFAKEILAEVERFERRNWVPKIVASNPQPIADFGDWDSASCPEGV